MQRPVQGNARPARAAIALASAITLSAAAIPARAAELNWAGDDVSAGGPGTWVQDGTTANWLDPSSVLVPWSPDNLAVFPAAGATVAVSGTVSGVQALRFTSTGYTLNGGTIAIPTPSAATIYTIESPGTGSVVINSILTGGGGANANIRKTGAGEALFTANNTLSLNPTSTGALVTPIVFGSTGSTFGGFTVNAGVATFTGDNTGVTGQFSAAGTGATLAAGSNTAFGTTNRIRLDAGSALRSNDSTTRTLNNVFDVATDTTLGSTNVALNGTLVLTTNNFNIGSGAKTLTVNSPVTISGVVTSGASANNFTKAGPSTLELSGANTYDRPTAVTAGTLLVTGAGRLGSATNARDVTVGDNGLLDLRSATGGLSPNAILRVTSTDATPELNLTVDDAVSQFFVNSVLMGPGVYGSTASGAPNPGLANPDDLFSGTGQLTVSAVPEPSSVGVLAALATGFCVRRRRS